MSSSEKMSRPPSHLQIPKSATEPQAVIGWGEDVLERARELAREIDEHVRRILAVPTTTPVDD